MNIVIKKLIKPLIFSLYFNALFSIAVHADDFSLFASDKDYLTIGSIPDGSKPGFVYAMWITSADKCSKEGISGKLNTLKSFNESSKALSKSHFLCALYTEKALEGWGSFEADTKVGCGTVSCRGGDPTKPAGPRLPDPSLKEFSCSIDSGDKNIKSCTLRP